MDQQQPSVGRIVHYAIPGLDEHAAAIITCVHKDGSVNLAVYERHPEASTKPVYGVGKVRFSQDKEGGTWHWPERA